MILGLLSLCIVSVAASWLAELVNFPIPGPIVGLLVLTGICLYRGKVSASLDRASQRLMLYIPLLIMPSCIGIMDHWSLIKEEWFAILLAISLSTIFTIVTTPWLYAKLQPETK